MEDSVVYIITKYNENQWLEHNGKFVRYFVKDIDDIIIAVKEYCEEWMYSLIEDSITWDENKEIITFQYYEHWDEKKEYPEKDTLNTSILHWIRTI